jgi:hypothetical protein
MEHKSVCPTSVATILACQRIARSFRENIFELSGIRNEWDPELAISLNVWIRDTIEKHYNNPEELIKSEKYQNWHEIMVASLRCFSILKASINVDFKENKKFQEVVFQMLGYKDYFSQAMEGDQKSVYSMLKTFRENLTAELRHKFAEKVNYSGIFTRILDYAGKIAPFESCFGQLESPVEMDKYGRKEVEEIYDTVKDICLIAGAYYQFEPEKQDQFNFYKVIRNLE